MAVIWRSRARTATVVGPLSVGYANFAVAGLLTNKHLRLTVSGSEPATKTHTVCMSMDEAKRSAITMLRYVIQYGEADWQNVIDELTAVPKHTFGEELRIFVEGAEKYRNALATLAKE